MDKRFPTKFPRGIPALFRPSVPFLPDPAPLSLYVVYALHCGGNAVRNVQTHEALPARITYSPSHRPQLGYGVGVVYIPSPQPLIFFFPPFFSWGGASSVSGKGNKGPLCPVGVGPPFPWTPISPLTGTWRVRLKVGGGRARSNWGLAHHVMARRRLRSLCA